MEKPHKDQVVVITGGAGGIGSGMARTFAAAGARVVIAGRDKAKLVNVARGIGNNGFTCIPLSCDVTEPEQVEKLVAATVAEFGHLDVFVNNAGGAMFVKPPEKLRPEQWRAAIDLNLNSVFYCSAAAGQQMISQNGGRIINISSVAGIKNSPAFIQYGAARPGHQLTKSMPPVGQHQRQLHCARINGNGGGRAVAACKNQGRWLTGATTGIPPRPTARCRSDAVSGSPCQQENQR